MEKEIKITPPEGYEIDKENSTFERIKFKPVVKRWRDTNPKVGGYFLSGNQIRQLPDDYNEYWHLGSHDVFATEKHAKSAFAMAQISQIMTHDERFGGPVTDEEWNSNASFKYIIERYNNEIRVDSYYYDYKFLAFHTAEQRNLFLKENEDLVKDYLMID